MSRSAIATTGNGTESSVTIIAAIAGRIMDECGHHRYHASPWSMKGTHGCSSRARRMAQPIPLQSWLINLCILASFLILLNRNIAALSAVETF